MIQGEGDLPPTPNSPTLAYIPPRRRITGSAGLNFEKDEGVDDVIHEQDLESSFGEEIGDLNFRLREFRFSGFQFRGGHFGNISEVLSCGRLSVCMRLENKIQLRRKHVFRSKIISRNSVV